MQPMNVGVIGSGVFGLASAIELLARGSNVTVFDQGTVPYPKASSTDVSKAIRRTRYAGDNNTYVDLVEQAAKQWRTWENRFNTKIYHQTGGLTILDGFEKEGPMEASIRFLQARESDIEVLTEADAQNRFPQFRINKGEVCVYDPWTGYIESSRAISLMSQLAMEEGGSLRENALVTRVEEKGSHVDIIHNNTRTKFDRVVVATGAWIGKLLPEIGTHLRVTHQEFLLIEPNQSSNFVAGRMPVWGIDSDGENWYGFPILRGGYVKVSKDNLGKTVDPNIDRSGTPKFEEQALMFLKNRIPEIANGTIVDARSCLYTATPDDHFIIDWAPTMSRILVAGGGSGHGFKFGSSIGPVIADAVEDKHNALGDRFRIRDRFNLTFPKQQNMRGSAIPDNPS